MKREYLKKGLFIFIGVITIYCFMKLIYNFQETIVDATNKNEPSILARFLIDLAKAYSSFYNEYKIMSEVESEKNARIYLTYMVGLILKIAMNHYMMHK